MRAALVAVAVCGCYAPVPPEGVPCTPGSTPCPEPQVCSQAQSGGFECTSDPSGTDGGTTGGSDAPPPDAEMRSCSNDGLACNGGISASACGGACWVRCEEQVPYAIAVTRCTAWGGHTAPLRTQADVACFENFQIAQATWLGLEQKPDQNSPAAGWSWNGDGLAPAFQSWEMGEPNDSDGNENNVENCAAARPTGLWFDRDCPAPTTFACRR